MNYNIAILISLLICAFISFVVGFYSVLIFLDEKDVYFSIFQLIVTIILMMSMYSPLKFVLLKYMGIKIDDKNKEV